jgi:hypothetical protein
LTAFGFFFRRFLGRCFDRGDIREIVQSRAPVVYRQKACERSDQNMRTLAFQKFLDSRLSALYPGAEREN